MHNSSLTKKYEKLTDVQLVDLCQRDTHCSQEAMDVLVIRYSKIIKYKASEYRIYGFEQEDLVQEGLIGLMNAIRTFDIGRQVTFKTYANVCVDNKIKKILAHASTQKYKMLTGSLSLTEDLDFEADETEDPERIVIGRESFNMLKENSSLLLSLFEQKAFALFLEGYNYKKIGKMLDVSSKSVDNALQRVRKKLRTVMNNPE